MVICLSWNDFLFHLVCYNRHYCRDCKETAHIHTETHSQTKENTGPVHVRQHKESWAAACIYTLFVLDSVPSHLHVLIAANWF